MFDLAIIIIDQCSGVFFDRTQSVDLQPQVLDNFANAIGKVVSWYANALQKALAEISRLTDKPLRSINSGNTLV